MNDLDDFTFEYIVKNLHLIDLCQVAQVNQQSFRVARIEFHRRYRQKRIHLSLIEIATNYSDEHADCVTLYGLRNTLKVLRCFGDMISNLTIDIAGAARFTEYKFWLYLNKNCFESLQILHLHNVNFYLSINFEKVFNNLREISFTNCDFYENLYHIARIFPNLINIKFYGWNMLLYSSVCINQPLCKDLNEENIAEVLMYLPRF